MTNQTISLIPLTEDEFKTTLVAGSIKGAMDAVKAKSRDLWQVEPSKLKVIEGLNPRVMNDAYKAHIRDLAASIRENGYYQDQPMAGYVANVDGESVIYIYSGHSRLLAVALAISEGASIPRVPVSVSQAGLSIEEITIALIRGNGGKNLTYYESAVVCGRLVRYGFDLDEISVKTGIAVNLVRNRLSLMAAPLKLRELVANEVISATLAIEMIAEHGALALEKIEAAQLAASEAGKGRVTKARAAAPDEGIFARAKLVKKAAPQLYEAAGAVLDDPGYASLSAETRELLEGLLSEIRGKDGGAAGAEAGAADERQLAIELG